MSATAAETTTEPRRKRSFSFPSAITTLAIVTLAVWVAAIFIPSGRYQHDEVGAPVPGSFEQVESPLSFGERVQQLVLSPVNGLYGIQDAASGFVDTENLGRMFGSIGVVMFIMALGAFISVSFSTRSLEVAVASMADRVGSRGWLLVAGIMVLFSLLGSTMGFSVETFGFYPLLIPLFLALGYDRMVAAAAIVLGALTGSMASTVNPFSIGVASGEAGVSIGDGIVLRVVLWVVLTAMAVAFVLRYAARVRRDPSTSLVGFAQPASDDEEEASPVAPGTRLDRTQRWVLAITVATFALMIFSVIPWSSIFGATAGPAEDEIVHQTTTEPYWFELGWWFPQLTMLFVLAAVLVGVVARMGEGRIVSLIGRGAADMIGPAIVILLARGVSVIMTNTETLDTVLNAMERAVEGTSAAVFTALVTVVNIPLAFLIPSSSGHATLAMPLLAPLGDFAGVSRALVITAFQMGHGLMLLVAPTNAVVVGGLAIAKVGYDKYLRFVWPLLVANLVVVLVILGIAAGAG
ncbi:YfcC family protein [Cellulomonas palmilytica]|uniref:YfcC family protein n=1 Tax=Cellulomonas palmilytica TaxID=2608402 RepID=UPI001F407E60|nr:YfcC family protein [Cellulomonas palmilytica]UJP40517.1 YfcC family protein [Cellulomonas palmilytica]